MAEKCKRCKTSSLVLFKVQDKSYCGHCLTIEVECLIEENKKLIEENKKLYIELAYKPPRRKDEN